MTKFTYRAAHLKRHAPDNPQNDRRQPVVGPGRLAGDRADGRHVRYSRPRPMAYVRSFSASVPTNSCAGQATPGEARRGPQTVCRRAESPTHRSAPSTRRSNAIDRSHRSSRAQSRAGPFESDSWRRPRSCDGFPCLAHRERLAVFVFSGRPGTFAGGGGGGAPSRFARIHFPRSTGEVRVAYEVTVRTLPCPSTPARGLRRSMRRA